MTRTTGGTSNRSTSAGSIAKNRSSSCATSQAQAVSQHVMEAIRRAKMEWEAVFDSVQDLIVIVDHEGRIVRCNRAVIDKMATTYGDLLGRSLGEVFLGREASDEGNVFSGFESDAVGDVQFPCLPGWFTVSGYDARQVGQEPAGKVWVMTDVTGRKMMEIERSLLVAAIENADEGMMILDGDGKARYTNAAFERITGWKRVEGGREPLEWLEELGRDSGLAPFLKAIETGKRWRGNFGLCFPTEPAREFNAGVWPIRDSLGAVTGTVALLTDVTEALAARRREARMRELARMGWLVGGVAHEVRNPLYAIQTVMQALQSDLGDDLEYAALLDIVVGHVERLSTMMKELLELGKPIASTTMGVVSVVPLCRNVVEMWLDSHPSVPRESLRLSIEGEEETSVLADSDRLSQVVVNLLDNAQQASAPGAEIRIDVIGGDRECRIVVSDQGKGVDEAHLASAFEPFFTLRPRGTGLGLSIVKHVVEEHGGTVALRNNSTGPGCTAEIRLPRASEQEVDTVGEESNLVAVKATGESESVGSELALSVVDKARN